MNKYLILVIISSCLVISACTCPHSSAINQPARTLLVYIAGDNSLAGEVTDKIKALQAGWNPHHGTLLVYVDLPVAGGCFLQIHDTTIIDTVAVYGPEDSASAETFSRVIASVGKDFPADSYGLIFFSHSSGWLPLGSLQFPLRQSRSVGQDASADTGMELSDFADAITLDFDFIVFETCLMGGVEVAYALKDKARYMLASPAELLSPGFTRVYPDALRYLTDASIPVEKALINFASIYTRHAETDLWGTYRSHTLCILNLSSLNGMVSRIGQITGGGGFDEQPSGSLRGLQHFDRPGSYGDFPAYPRFFDLDEYIQSIASPADYDLFTEELAKTVVWKAASETFMMGYNGFPIRRYCGLTTYIPQSAFPSLNAAYRRTAWHRSLVNFGN